MLNIKESIGNVIIYIDIIRQNVNVVKGAGGEKEMNK